MMCDYCRTDGNRGARCECAMPIDQSNVQSLAYRAAFILGADKGGLHAIPEDVLSWAIDRAIQRNWNATGAGSLFAETYYRTVTKPDYRDPERRNGIMNRTAFLLSEFEKALLHA